MQTQSVGDGACWRISSEEARVRGSACVFCVNRSKQGRVLVFVMHANKCVGDGASWRVSSREGAPVCFVNANGW